MRRLLSALALAVALLGGLDSKSLCWATDRDGPDCLKNDAVDWGDAPEGVLAYPGVIGKFPTCRSMNLVGTQELPAGCPPISTFPHVTGHIFHRQNVGPAYWLGCYFDAAGQALGTDRDQEGKVNQPPTGTSFCTNEGTDCVESAYGLSWDQDECAGDGSDACLNTLPVFTACQPFALTFTTYSCDTNAKSVFLNICVDMNHDGDWNDAELCSKDGNSTCVYEWAVKNQVITLPAGCATLTSPAFPIGPTPGPSWMRISLTSEPVTDDYPWAGGAGDGGVQGGETEDYPGTIQAEVPTVPSSWGNVKATYR